MGKSKLVFGVINGTVIIFKNDYDYDHYNVVDNVSIRIYISSTATSPNIFYFRGQLTMSIPCWYTGSLKHSLVEEFKQRCEKSIHSNQYIHYVKNLERLVLHD